MSKTIEEAKMAKQDLEERITKLLTDYEREYGVTVDDCYIERDDKERGSIFIDVDTVDRLEFTMDVTL